MIQILTLLVIILAPIANSRSGFGPTDQEWGHVNVRPNAYIFWWLHKTTANVGNYTSRPLVIWLQGGPGSSSTGFGNFAEIGPIDSELNPRNSSWTNNVNLLFVDNPVGTGYSYVDDFNAYASNNTQIATDFVNFLKGFLEDFPEWENVPLYIFSESYGGKMTVEIALAIHEASRTGSIKTKLNGIGLGDPWVSPIDSVITWAPYLLNLGIIDSNGFNEIQGAANATKVALDNNNYSLATTLWSATESLIEFVTNNVDFYNALSLSKCPLENMDTKINELMNGPVKEALGVNNSWGYQSAFVSMALNDDFMKPVTDIVEILLNTTDIKVAVYNGQLDLIVDTPGTITWVDNLKFPKSELWFNADRNPIVVNNTIEGYYKKLGNLAMYWVDRAGHMVPCDNDPAMFYILNDVCNNFE